MIIDFKNGIVEDYTLVLSKRDYEHLGKIINVSGVVYKRNLNSANELSFSVTKDLDGKIERLWDEIYDIRLVWVKELNEYFEITVSKSETTDIVKNITGTSLCEAELGQTNLYGIEINTDDDLLIPYDYDSQGLPLTKASIFYDPNVPKKSILHRILDKVPQYKIGNVAIGLIESSRTPEFTFDGTSVLDALYQVAEEFDCMFQFDSATRTVNVVDLETVCMNDDCAYYKNENNQFYKGSGHKHYRGIFNDVCPKCGSTNLKYFGTDTTICVGVENLTDEITYEADTDNIKNTFRLKCGDDLTTAYAIEANNGNQYIYSFPEETIRDMSDGLQDRLKYHKYITEKYNGDYVNVIKCYYDCISKYEKYYYKMMPKSTASYKVPDNLKERMEYFEKQIRAGFSANPIALAQKVRSDNLTPATTYMLAMAKVYADTAYINIERPIGTVVSEETIDGVKYATKVSYTFTIKDWDNEYAKDDSGKLIGTRTFKVENLTINAVDLNYYASQMQKTITSSNSLKEYDMLSWLSSNAKIDDNGNITYQSYTDIFSNSNIEQLKKDMYNTIFADKTGGTGYCYKMIKNIADAYGVCVSTLQSLKGNLGEDKSLISESTFDPIYNAYKSLYDTATTCLNERLSDVLKYKYPGGFEVESDYDKTESYKKSIVKPYIDDVNKLKKLMDFNIIIHVDDSDFEAYKTNPENFYKNNSYIGKTTDKYYHEFCSFRREDTYENSNFISDNITDDNDLFTLVYDFLETANKELIKSSTYQYNISSNLKNLLLIPEFKPLTKYFDTGNWIRFKLDDSNEDSISHKCYRLRLISFEIKFDDLQTINCEFSNLTQTADGYNDVQSIFSQAKSMASSYSTVTRQADESTAAVEYVQSAVSSGLTTALAGIKDANHQEVVINDGGYLGRKYDPFTEDYESEQLRISNNLIVFTSNNWENSEEAIGKHSYYKWSIVNNKATQGNQLIGYGVTAKFLTADSVVADSSLYGTKIFGGHIYSSNYDYSGSNKKGTHIDLENGNITTPKWYVQGEHFHLGEGNNYLDFNNGKLTFGSDVTLSWGQITETDNIATKNEIPTGEQITQITKDTVTTSYVNALNVTAKDFSAETISGKTIIGSVFKSQNKSFGDNTKGVYINSDEFNYCWTEIDESGNTVYCHLTINTNNDSYGGMKIKIGDEIVFASNSVARIYGMNFGRHIDISKLSVRDLLVDGQSILTESASCNKNWNWSGKDGQPTWLWGGEDGKNMYVYNPSNFNVNYANSAGSANSLNSGNSYSMQSLELYFSTPYIDFHYNNNATDYTTRLIEDLQGRLSCYGDFKVTGQLRSVGSYNTTTSAAPNCHIANNDYDNSIYRSTSSSKRYKFDICDAEISEIKKLYDLPIRKYKYKLDYLSDFDERYNKDIYGFIAEELDELMPIAVNHNQDGSAEMWNSNIIVPCLLGLIQDLNIRLNEIEKERTNNG